MLRQLIGTGLLVATCLALPALSDAQGPKKKKGQPKEGGGEIDSGKLRSGVFVGTLKAVPGSDRTFVLTLETKRLEPTGKGGGGRIGGGNPNLNRVVQAQQRMQQAQAQLARARNPQQRNQAQQQLVRAQQQLTQALASINRGGQKSGAGGAPPGFRVVTTTQNIDFQAMEDLKVRTLQLPEVFDDKGLIKKYTTKELTELKGKDKNLKGYESAQDKLGVGQKVEVHLAPAKKGKVDALAEDTEKKMQVKMIVILEESMGTTGREKGKEKEEVTLLDRDKREGV